MNDPVNYYDVIGLQTTLVLPPAPGSFPPGWEVDPKHKDPNGTRLRNPETGDYVDFHKGQAGKKGWKGKDHYHHNGGEKHLKPGTEIKLNDVENNVNSCENSGTGVFFPVYDEDGNIVGYSDGGEIIDPNIIPFIPGVLSPNFIYPGTVTVPRLVWP